MTQQPSQGIVDLINSILNTLQREETVSTETESRNDTHWRYTIVTGVDKARDLKSVIEGYFGEPAKSISQTAYSMTKPLPNKFVHDIGWILPGQTLYAKVENQTIEYLAIWPWNDRTTTTIHIGTYTMDGKK